MLTVRLNSEHRELISHSSADYWTTEHANLVLWATPETPVAEYAAGTWAAIARPDDEVLAVAGPTLDTLLSMDVTTPEAVLELVSGLDKVLRRLALRAQQLADSIPAPSVEDAAKTGRTSDMSRRDAAARLLDTSGHLSNAAVGLSAVRGFYGKPSDIRPAAPDTED